MSSSKNLLITCLFMLSSMFATSASAGNLCEDSCLFTIDYSEGGSITAVEPVTITFGDGGFVDNGATIEYYSLGSMITLLAGESLDFGVGGYFDLGVGGNIDYTDIAITGGDGELSAIGGNETVRVYTLSIDMLSLVFNSSLDVVVDGELIVDVQGSVDVSGSTFTNTGTVNVQSGTLNLVSFVWVGTNGDWSDPVNWQGGSVPGDGTGVVIGTGAGTLITSISGSGSLTLSGASGFELDLSSSGSVINSGQLSIDTVIDPDAVINPGVFVLGPITGGVQITPLDANLSVDFDGTLVRPLWQIDEGVITLSPEIEFAGFSGMGSGSPTFMMQDYSDEEFAELFNGALFVTPDGGTCEMEDDACLTDAGARYVLVDGELVLEENGSSLSLCLLSLFGLLPVLRQRRFLCMR